jgi:hypothetical protein
MSPGLATLASTHPQLSRPHHGSGDAPTHPRRGPPGTSPSHCEGAPLARYRRGSATVTAAEATTGGLQSRQSEQSRGHGG